MLAFLPARVGRFILSRQAPPFTPVLGGDELAPDFLLVDSRTGITELGGLATSILADRVVCLTTTAPESVEDTRVVAEALRTAPRLTSQQPLRIDFLITRVTPKLTNSTYVSEIIKQLKELGGSVAVLPHDSDISETADSGENTAGGELYSATVAWIAEAFQGRRT